MVLTHTDQYGEEYYSFVNGQHTTQGGTHLTAFREYVSRTIKFSGKGYEFSDIRNGMVAAVSVRIQSLSSRARRRQSSAARRLRPTARLPSTSSSATSVKKELDDYLHKHTDTAEVMLKKIAESEKDRKAMAGITKLAREKARR